MSQVKLRVAKTTIWQWARASEHFFRFCFSVNYRSTSGMLILKWTTSKWVPSCATMPTSHGHKTKQKPLPWRNQCRHGTGPLNMLWPLLWMTTYLCDRWRFDGRLALWTFLKLHVRQTSLPDYERFHKRYLLFCYEWTPAPHPLQKIGCNSFSTIRCVAWIRLPLIQMRSLPEKYETTYIWREMSAANYKKHAKK